MKKDYWDKYITELMIEMGSDDWPVEEFDWLTFAIGADGELGWNWGDLAKVKPGITQEECEVLLKEMNEELYYEALAVAA